MFSVSTSGLIGRLLLVTSVLVAAAGCGSGPASPSGGSGVPASVAFNVADAEVPVGQSLQLSVVARDESGAVVPNVTVTWKSLNPTIASVSPSGVVTPIDFGDADIEADVSAGSAGRARLDDLRTAGRWAAALLKMLVVPVHAAGSAKGHATMHVTPNIVISPANPTIAVDGTQQFVATYPGMTSRQISSLPPPTWSSDNTAVATIDISAFARAKANGSTNITATVKPRSGLSGHDKTRLTVSSPCDSIGLVTSFTADVQYNYVVNGPGGSGAFTLNSRHQGTLHAVLVKPSSTESTNTLEWLGPLTGSASQVDTRTDRSGHTDGQEGDSLVDFPGIAGMFVQVDLLTCQYKVEVVVYLNIKVTGDHPAGPFPSSSVTIVKAFSKLGPRTLISGLGDPFFGLDFFDQLMVPTRPDADASTPGDFFEPDGFLNDFDGQLPKATVTMNVKCTRSGCS